MYENCRIYGPYKRKDGRAHVIAIDKDGNRRTVSYPKFIMENHIGRYLLENETVDHKDTDFTNNDLINLRIVNRVEHIKDDVRRSTRQDFICPECCNKFSLSGNKLNRAVSNRKLGKSGPFCGRSCAGKYGKRIQMGDPLIDVIEIVPKYTTTKAIRSLQEETLEVEAAKTGKP